MRHTAHALRAWVLAAVAASELTGCVLPVAEPPRTLEGQRGNLEDRVPAFIVEGRTTREEVLLTLGEPDRIADEERWLAYDTARLVGGITLYGLVAGGYSTSAGGVIGTYHTVAWRELTLRFDAQGVVSKAEFVEQRDRRLSLLDMERPYPHAKHVLQLSPTVQAHREAMRTFVPAEPDERLREGFIAAACQFHGQWHEALASITDRAVYCWTPAQADGTTRQVLLRWAAADIDPPDWAAGEAASERPAVQLRHRDGTAALFAFHPIDGPAADFDRRRAELFLESVRQLQRGGPR